MTALRAMTPRKPRHGFALDDLPAVLPPPRVGVWDQVLKFGIFEKESIDGEEGLVTVFDETTCNQMLDDFAARENDFFMDAGHSILEGGGEALCYHNALVLVVDGAVRRIVSRDPGLAEPSIDELRRPGGAAPTNGIYARRSMLTSLGIDPHKGLSTYRYVSPFYSVTPKGYRLINATATNVPYLQGVALAMEDRRKEKKMDPKDQNGAQPADQPGAQVQDNAAAMKAVMEAAGVKDTDTPEEKVLKMAGYMAKMAAPKPAAGAAMQEVGTTAPAELPAGASAAPPPAGGAPTIPVPGQPGLQPPTAPLQGGAGGNYMASMQELQRTVVRQDEELKKIQAEQMRRAAEEKKAAAVVFAMTAQSRGRVKTRKDETHAQARERIASLYLKGGEEFAMSALDDEGANPVPGDLLRSFSAGGKPVHGGFEGTAVAMEDPGAEIARLARERVAKEGKAGQRGAFNQAAKAVAAERPELRDAWAGGRGVYPFGFGAQ